MRQRRAAQNNLVFIYFMQKFSLVLFCLALTFTAACSAGNTASDNVKTSSANQAPPTHEIDKPARPNPAEAVRVSADVTEIKQGSSGEAVLKLEIIKPFHVNANPPTDKNLIPTEIQLDAQNGISGGKPVYPAGEQKEFPFSEGKKLSVYEGSVIVRLPLKAEASAAKGAQTLNGKLRFQPCDNEVCYRPQTIDVSLPVTIN